MSRSTVLFPLPTPRAGCAEGAGLSLLGVMSETLLDRLRSALAQTDSAGRFSPGDVDEIRSMAKDLVDRGGAVHLEPADLLGPWPDLPAHVQAYLRGWAEEEIRGAMAFHPRGRIWPGAVRGIHTIGQFLGRRQRLRALRQGVMSWSPRLWRRPQMIRASVLGGIRKRRWSRSRRPKIEDLLAALGKNAYWIMGAYAEGVCIDSRCRGFYHDPERNTVWGYLLGLDLVTTPSGVVCHEANLSPGLHEKIRRGYWDRDPIPIGLADFADRHELGRILWMNSSQTPIEPWFYSQLRDGLADRRIGLEVLEDTRLPKRRDIPEDLPVPARGLFPPSDPSSNTVVVRLCGYRVGPDFFLSNKDAFGKVVGQELWRSGEVRVKVLSLTSGSRGRSNSPMIQVAPTSSTSTLWKIRGRVCSSSGHGTPSMPERWGRKWTGPQGRRVGSSSPGFLQRSCGTARSTSTGPMILVTPVGIQYLGARRRETVTPLPDKVPEGVVEDRKPFIITGYFGNVSVPVDPAEEALLEGASVAIGEAIARVISRGFKTKGGN